MAAAPRGPSELPRPPGTRAQGVRCAGPGVAGELSRCGPPARRRRAWTRADSQRRAAGRAGPEGVPPGRRAALCEPRGGKGRRAWRAAGRCAPSVRLPPDPVGAVAPAPTTPSAPRPPPGRFPRARGRRCASPGRRRGEVLPGRVAAPEAHVRRRAEEADSGARPGRGARSPPTSRKGF